MCGKIQNETRKNSRTIPLILLWNILSLYKKNMKKYLDILLFSLLFFFIFSYFQWKNEKAAQEWIVFSSQKSEYSIPAGVMFEIQNNTDVPLVFDTCTSLEIRSKGELVSLPESLCGNRTIPSRSQFSLDLTPQYTLFENIWEYDVLWTVGDKKFNESFEISYKGNISKLFTEIFYAPVYNLMAFLIHTFGNSLWWAILAITCIIRVILLFPQHKMMVSQRKLQAIQPKIKKLQQEYKGKQQELGVKLMELYKEEKVNPLGSCGPLLIQMPILFVLYNIISHITSLKNEFYLYSFLPEFHISQIDPNFFGIDLLASGGITGIILAIIVAFVQYLQMKFSLSGVSQKTQKWEVVLEKKKDSEEYQSFMPDPEMMNKFMLYGMPVMVWFFTYSLIAWVGLYWGTSTCIALLQQIFVNKIIKK